VQIRDIVRSESGLDNERGDSDTEKAKGHLDPLRTLR
jgi:hypothetical protein